VIYDLVEEKSHTFGQIIAAWRAWLGYREAPLLSVPNVLGRFAFQIGDALGTLGWRSPLRKTALQQIEAGITGDPTAWVKATNRPLSSLSASLRRLPATVQERWFGRLWFLKPIIIATLSLFWLASGSISLAQMDLATGILTTHGFGAREATLVATSGSLLDISLGLAILFRGLMPWAALGMIATTAMYLLAGSVVVPELWGDPLGPYVKTIPGAVLALVCYAITEER
jgi:hypothetical protein